MFGKLRQIQLQATFIDSDAADPESTLLGLPIVYAAFVCAAAQGQSEVVVRPIQLAGFETLIAVAWKPLDDKPVAAEDWCYVSFLDGGVKSHGMLQASYEEYCRSTSVPPAGLQAFAVDSAAPLASLDSAFGSLSLS